MTEIKVPQINANDESVVLVEWAAAEGARINEGELLAVLETSKITYELVAQTDGYLHTVGQIGQEYDCGYIIGFITEEANETTKDDRVVTLEDRDQGELIFTKAAEDLLELSDLSRTDFAELGKKLIREEDVKQMLSQSSVQSRRNLQRLSPVQMRVVEAVTKSHNDIPAAYTSITIYYGQVESMIGAINKERERNLGLSELIIWSLARVREEFPLFFARYLGEGQVEVLAESNIAVTTDVGNGLFLPVIKNADSKSLEEIEDELTRLRLEIMRNTASREMFDGGTIGLSLNPTPNIGTVIPIIPPSFSAIVVAGGAQETVVFREGSCQPDSMLTLGVSYDHRVINGGLANRFLTELKILVEGMKS